MDDPGLAWPFWKFGLKQDDLFTKLNDQYNTFTLSIQDPEAFHHDVYELSHEAKSLDEFYSLLAYRKQQRIRELNESLESAAVEIIANPSLIGTEQWQHALQLFRTKSLDSLVSYFASYLPDNHPWRDGRYGGSSSDAGSSVDSVGNSNPSIFDYHQDEIPEMYEEPIPLSGSIALKAELPASPRSMTMSSDSSVASPMDSDQHSYVFDNLTPARSMSFSESEPELSLQDSLPLGKMVPPNDTKSQSSSVSDVSEAAALEKVTLTYPDPRGDCEDDVDATQSPTEATESETPTPRPMPSGMSFFDTKLSLPRRRHRSLSPSRHHSLISPHSADHDIRDVRQTCASPTVRRRDGASRLERRRSPGLDRLQASRVRKPLLDYGRRSRPRGRSNVDGCS
jgi:hypothetical protein